MLLSISIDTVREAIESRHVPQCYEQILHTVQNRLGPGTAKVSSQAVARHVRTLLGSGDVVELLDPAVVARLGAFPQHFRKSTKFFLGVDVARERLGNAAVGELLTRQHPAPPPGLSDRTDAARAGAAPDEQAAPTLFELAATTAEPPPSATRPETPREVAQIPAHAVHAVQPSRRRRGTADDTPDTPTTTAPRTGRLSAGASAPPSRTGTPHPLRARTPPKVVYGVTGTGTVVSSLQPQFSSGPPTPAASAEQTLDEITARLAHILDDTARVLGDYADNTVLPLNRAWHDGDFGTDAPRVADRLSHLYTVARTYRDDLAALAAALDCGEPTPEPARRTRA